MGDRPRRRLISTAGESIGAYDSLKRKPPDDTDLRRAVMVIASHARDADDARDLLTVLGIVRIMTKVGPILAYTEEVPPPPTTA